MLVEDKVIHFLNHEIDWLILCVCVCIFIATSSSVEFSNDLIRPLLLQEHSDLVLASRNPALGNGVQSISEWLDMRGLDRRLRNSDIAPSSPRYDINRPFCEINTIKLLVQFDNFDPKRNFCFYARIHTYSPRVRKRTRDHWQQYTSLLRGGCKLKFYQEQTSLRVKGFILKSRKRADRVPSAGVRTR
jgi:hypothetical protein